MYGRYRLSRADKLAGRFGIDPDEDWIARYKQLTLVPFQFSSFIPLSVSLSR